MFLVRTRIGPSQIHGNGVFACENIDRGTTVWRFEPQFDRIITEEEWANLPPVFREHVDMFGYRSGDLGGRLVLSCDHAKFLNHSADPNTEELPFRSVASRYINSGEEITCNYGTFCVDWTGFDER
jgi:uncharacterized protein